MKGVLIIISPKGAVSSHELTAPVTLSDLVAGIGGGYLEAVPGFKTYEGKRCVAFCDEDGKRKDMPVNRPATELWYAQMKGPFNFDVLVGPVVIVTGDAELMEAL